MVLIWAKLTKSLVDMQVPLFPGFMQANSQSWRLSLTVSEVKKQDTKLYFRQIESLHSPPWHTWYVGRTKTNDYVIFKFNDIVYDSGRGTKNNFNIEAHTWVPSLHSVTLSGLNFGSGHLACFPSQMAAAVQSSSPLHWALLRTETYLKIMELISNLSYNPIVCNTFNKISMLYYKNQFAFVTHGILVNEKY